MEIREAQTRDAEAMSEVLKELIAAGPARQPSHSAASDLPDLARFRLASDTAQHACGIGLHPLTCRSNKRKFPLATFFSRFPGLIVQRVITTFSHESQWPEWVEAAAVLPVTVVGNRRVALLFSARLRIRLASPVLPTRDRGGGQIARKLKMTAKSLKLPSYLFIAAAFTLSSPAVQAGSHGNGGAGEGFPQYRNLADAQKACGRDTVVWGSSEHRGVFYVDGAGPRRIGGFYACMAVAQKAGMQIVTSN